MKNREELDEYPWMDGCASAFLEIRIGECERMSEWNVVVE